MATSRRAERDASRKRLRLEYLFLIPVGLAVVVLVCALWPFSPYVFYGYKGVPQQACPGDIVQVYSDREILDGYHVNRLDANVYWVSADAERVSAGGSAVLYVTAAPRALYPSVGVRRAPYEPGEWRVGATLTVTGRIGILPRHQNLDLLSEQTMTVLEPTDEACRGRPVREIDEGKGSA